MSIPLFDVPCFCFVASFWIGRSFTRALFGTVVECDDGNLRGLSVGPLNIEYCEFETSLTDNAGVGERDLDEGLLRFRPVDSLGPDGSNSGVVCLLGEFSVAEEEVLIASRAGAFLAVPFFVSSFFVSRRRRGVGPRDAFWRRFSARLA